MRPLRIISVSLLLWLAGSAPAHGDDFFRVSPGPLAAPHAKWEEGDHCGKCHKIGKGVTQVLCLDCHTHRPLREMIKKGVGLHASFKKKCVLCHTEHKGRQHNISNWASIGGRSTFDHKRTGFALEGRHDKLSCSACHRKRLRSGRISYPGLQPRCEACHRQVHRFDEPKLQKDCRLCHDGIKAPRTLTASSAKRFEHATLAHMKLVGKHARTRCIRCHKGRVMGHRATPRTCKNCHRSPHGKRFVQKSCRECHSARLKWKQTKVDHDKTHFPLRGKHVGVSCGKCHRKKPFKPSTRCAECHAKVHKKRFARRDCATCHHKPGFKDVVFDHSMEAKFNLLGKHAKATCRDCHRGKTPDRFEKHKDHSCTSCHKHRKAHGGQYAAADCLRCHVEGGQRTSPFDHNKDSRFALTGFHQQALDKAPGKKKARVCAKCHPGGKRRTGTLRCADCHKDSHKGQLGTDCARCHKTQVHFKKTQYDHAANKRFKRQGTHAKVPCEKCHPGKKYKLGKDLRCVVCHKSRDPHKGKLGDACEKCHRPEKGAPLFVHETMTPFRRDGAHAKVACSFCHRPADPQHAPPKVGWTKGQTPAKVDKGFPVMGKKCADCHLDEHQGRYGDRCDSCHKPTRFKDATRAIHDTGSARLSGRHDQVACRVCHSREIALTGLGEQCVFCHQDDDIHRGGLGADCGGCHAQEDWAPARFSHGQTGTVLRGAHRVARCEGCHPAGQYQGISHNCADCHFEQAIRIVDPLHSAELSRCDDCHSQVSFAPARVSHLSYPLHGAHRGAVCQACHGNGLYAGTADRCEDCHQADYDDASNSPNHRAAGFSTHCEDCHRPIDWRSARYQHLSFVLRGRHLSLDCGRCHPGEQYNTAIGGAGFVCDACHGRGAPAAAWPDSHDQQGYPSSCELCHGEQAWTPARRAP